MMDGRVRNQMIRWQMMMYRWNVALIRVCKVNSVNRRLMMMHGMVHGLKAIIRVVFVGRARLGLMIFNL